MQRFPVFHHLVTAPMMNSIRKHYNIFCASISLAILATFTSDVRADIYFWNGPTSGSDNWEIAENWISFGSGYPYSSSDIASFGNLSDNLSVTIFAPFTVLNGLSFTDTGGYSLTITGSTINFDGAAAFVEMTADGALLDISSSVSLATDVEFRNNSTGVMQFSSAIGGSGSVTIAGNSTVVYSEANFYSGGTTISNGTLTLATTNALSGNLTLDGGSLSFLTPEAQDSLGVLNVQSASSIELLDIALYDLVFTTNIDTSNVLTIENWVGNQNGGTGGRIIFSGYTDGFGNSDPAAAIAANTQFLNAVQFTGFSNTGATFIDAGGGNVQLVPVPEPMTAFGLGTAGLGLIGWLRRRQPRTQPQA